MRSGDFCGRVLVMWACTPCVICIVTEQSVWVSERWMEASGTLTALIPKSWKTINWWESTAHFLWSVRIFSVRQPPCGQSAVLHVVITTIIQMYQYIKYSLFPGQWHYCWLSWCHPLWRQHLGSWVWHLDPCCEWKTTYKEKCQQYQGQG